MYVCSIHIGKQLLENMLKAMAFGKYQEYVDKLSAAIYIHGSSIHTSEKIEHISVLV